MSEKAPDPRKRFSAADITAHAAVTMVSELAMQLADANLLEIGTFTAGLDREGARLLQTSTAERRDYNQHLSEVLAQFSAALLRDHARRTH